MFRINNIFNFFTIVIIAIVLFLFYCYTPEKAEDYIYFKESNNLDAPIVTYDSISNDYTINSKLPYIISYNGSEYFNHKVTKPLTNISLIPTSYRWKPQSELVPMAKSIKICAIDKSKSEKSKWRYFTFSPRKSKLSYVNIFIDNEDLFDYFKGIYVVGASELNRSKINLREKWWDKPANYKQRGPNWEKEGYMQFFSAEGNLLSEQDILVRINGNATRAFPQKSLRLKAKNRIENYFFDLPHTSFKSIILRNSGNDWDKTIINDRLAHDLVSKCMIDSSEEIISQKALPIILYINGFYWGIHNLRPRIDQNYLSDLFFVKKKEISIIEGDSKIDGPQQDLDKFKSISKWISQADFSQNQNLDLFKKSINYNNFVYYLSFQIFSSNTDWPKNNIKCFMSTSDKVPDRIKRWNWILWDMDYAFSYLGEKSETIDMFEHLSKSNSYLGKWFNSLLKNDQFKFDLKTRIDQLINCQEFSSANLTSLKSTYLSNLKEEMQHHVARWRYPKTYEEWLSNVSNLFSFFEKRKQFVTLQSKKWLCND